MPMRTLILFALVSFFAIFLLSSTVLAKKKGTLLYLDAISNEERTRVAQALGKQKGLIYLSPEDYENAHQERHYKSTVLSFDKAVEQAKSGKTVVFDAEMIEKFFETKAQLDREENPSWHLYSIGIWCSLSCLKKQMEGEDGDAKLNSKKFTHLESDYGSRYGDKSPDQVRASQGKYYFTDKIPMNYDLFLDFEKATTEDLVKTVMSFLNQEDIRGRATGPKPKKADEETCPN